MVSTSFYIAKGVFEYMLTTPSCIEADAHRNYLKKLLEKFLQNSEQSLRP